MIVLRQPENSFLLFEIPNHNIAVLTALSGRELLTVVRDGKASNLIVVRG